MEIGDQDGSRCPNCGSDGSGRFCAECGQEQGELFPTVRSWVHDAAGELLGVEGKLITSLRSLAWPPGDLTLEWYRGRRTRFVRPFRLYLAAALLFFLAWPQTPFSSELESFTEGFVAGGSGSVDAESEIQLGVRVVLDSLPGLMIILFVPLFAGFLRLAHRGGPYVGHLVMALHAHTVVFVAVAMTAPINALFGPSWEDIGMPFLMLGLLGLFVTSMARVYRLVWWRALARGVVVSFVYAAVLSMVVGVVLWIVLESA